MRKGHVSGQISAGGISTLPLPDGGFGGVGFFGAATFAPLAPGALCPGGAL